jgi:hypothetical protein
MLMIKDMQTKYAELIIVQHLNFYIVKNMIQKSIYGHWVSFFLFWLIINIIFYMRVRIDI